MALEPLEPGTLIATATPRIRHRPGGASGWPHDPISSDGDYSDTNAWLNRLLDAPVAGARLVDYVRHDGVGMWQFLPSYIWPQVFLAIELVKALDALVGVVGERGLRPLPVADALNGTWTGVVEEYARARGLAFEPAGPSPSASPGRRLARAARVGYLRDRAIDAGAVAGARAIGAVAQRRAGRRPRTGASVLLASVPRHWTVAPDGSGRHYDEQFTPLVEALRAAGFGRIVGIECPYGPKLDALRSVMRRVRGDNTGVTWRSFDGDGGGASARRRAAPLFREQWEALVSGALDSDAADFGACLSSPHCGRRSSTRSP